MATPLWRYLLDHLEDIGRIETHQLSRDHVVVAWKGLALLGELPEQSTLRDDLKGRRQRTSEHPKQPAWHLLAKDLLALNKGLLADPGKRLRRVKRSDNPLATLDLVCERNRLAPPDRRLARVTAERALAVADAAEADPERFLAAHRDLQASTDAFVYLRQLRLGVFATGPPRYIEESWEGRAGRPAWWQPGPGSDSC